MAGKKLVFEAFDQDLTSSEALGSSKSISLLSLVESEDLKTHNLVLGDKEGKTCGELTITTQFVVRPPHPEINNTLNKNCLLKLVMDSSEFSFQLMYDDNLLKIKAGEELELKNMFEMARLDKQL